MEFKHIAKAHELLLEQKHGVLSTLSIEMPGFPFGSVTPYCIGYSGKPIILISDLAQHTKNIIANQNVSLTILEPAEQDVQASSRLTYLAEAKKVSENINSISERYYRYFPSSRGYHQTHDFEFYELTLVKARFIGGFGQIGWIGIQHLEKPNPFDAKTETDILEHMNQDHQKAMHHYCSSFKKIEVSESVEISMIGIDEIGFDLMVHQKIVRFMFNDPIYTLDEAKKVLISMAHS